MDALNQTLVTDTPVMVEVIILTYNHEQLIEQAVTSVVEQQTSHRFHVTVHDDASEDKTPHILRDLAAQWPDLISLTMRETNGLSRGFNPSVASILATDSKYFAWCEGDDWWTDTGKLQKQIDFMETNPWCALSHHDVEIVIDSGGDAEYALYLRQMQDLDWRREQRVDGLALARGNFILTSSAMVRRSAIAERTLRAVYDVQPGDWVTMALAAEGGDIGFIDQTMAAYRLHQNNYWAGEAAAHHEQVDKARWFLGTYSTGRMAHAVRRGVVDEWLGGNSHPMIEEVERLQQEVADMQRQSADTELQLASMRSQSEELARVRQELERNLESKEELLDRMESSRGWRLLERLRRIKRRV